MQKGWKLEREEWTGQGEKAWAPQVVLEGRAWIRTVLETGRGRKTEHKECTEVLRRKREPGEGYGVNGRAYRKRKGRGAHMCFSYVKW